MLLFIHEAVLNPKFSVVISKTATCTSWTDRQTDKLAAPYMTYPAYHPTIAYSHYMQIYYLIGSSATRFGSLIRWRLVVLPFQVFWWADRDLCVCQAPQTTTLTVANSTKEKSTLYPSL